MLGRKFTLAATVALALGFGLQTAPAMAADSSGPICPSQGLWLQVLGAGGPEVEDEHASTGYLVWLDGKARLLVDIGGGAALRFGQSHANFSDLDAIAISHFHVDHSAGLPVLIKSSFFGDRKRPLPLFGPAGNKIMPSPKAFIDGLFAAPNGIYHYLSRFVTDGEGDAYQIKAQEVPLDQSQIWQGFSNERLELSAVPVHHGPLPALAWRVDIAGHSITFSGDMNGELNTLPKLAKDTDLLVAHNAIPEGLGGTARNLHMPPSVIGMVAHEANVKRLVLSHRMRRTFGKEEQTLAAIRTSYKGPADFAEDLQCFEIKGSP